VWEAVIPKVIEAYKVTSTLCETGAGASDVASSAYCTASWFAGVGRTVRSVAVMSGTAGTANVPGTDRQICAPTKRSLERAN
jgi:hypothetical protein